MNMSKAYLQRTTCLSDEGSNNAEVSATRFHNCFEGVGSAGASVVGRSELKDEEKTREELLDELNQMRSRLAELEQIDDERKRADEESRRATTFLDSIIENIPDMIFVKDAKDLRFLRFNRAGEELLGLSRDDLLGKNDYDFFPKRQADFFTEKDRDVLRGNEIVDIPEEPIQTRNKGERILHTKKVPIIDAKGEPDFLLGISEDITDRKRAEEALKDSEQQLQSIIQGYPIPAFVIGKDHRVIHWNKALEEVSGIGASSVIGTSQHWRAFYREERPCMADLLVDEDQGTVAHWYPESINKSGGLDKAYEATQFFPDLGGVGKWLRFTVAPLRNSRGMIVGAIETLEDVTDHKQAEEDLRESENRYRAIFENTGTVTLIVEEDTTISYANAEFEKLTGYRREEVENKKSWTEFVADEDLETMMVQHRLRRVDADAARKQYEFRSVDKQGQTKDVLLTVGMIAGTKRSVASLIDITERKRAEEALRESQRQLASIIDFLPDATLVIDKEGRVIAWNRAMEAMTCVKAGEMIGKGNHEYSLPFYGDRRPILIDLALHPNQEMERHYTAIQRREDIVIGEAFTPGLPPGDLHLSATASVLRDSKGDIIAAIECIRDNTERKRLEERLSRAEKMEALGTLAGGVAHDLNNVLGVLVGYSELLLEKIPKGDPLNRHVSHILQSSERGAAIIQDLLTLARRGVAVSEVINLNDVVSDFFRTPECEKLKDYHPNVAFRTDLEKDLLHIKGSPIHLEKTVVNLVSNAAEAISGGGVVTIRTENRYLDKPLRGYDDMQEGDYVVLTVSDNGKGISAADLGKIFEPFYTKKVMGRSGTGLGLAVVWGTVKDHDGYIDAQSEEGKGSTFAIYFPVTREELTKDQQKISPDQYMGSQESILVVDDVEGQRELAVSMLTRLDYRAYAVSSGEEAVAYIKSNKVDLLVLDMIMEPGIDGLETFQRVLEISPKQKAILVSGFSETERVTKAQALGAGAYVRKPYMLEKLGLAVKEELDQPI